MDLVLILDLPLLSKRAQTENSNQDDQKDAYQSVWSPTVQANLAILSTEGHRRTF